MAAYSTSQTGNWSATATWGGAGPPGEGDTVTSVGHAVTMDGNVTLGTSPSPRAVELTINALLTVAAAVTFTMKGEIQQGNANFVQAAGSTVRILAPSGLVYRHIIASGHFQASAILDINGTAGSRATYEADISLGGTAVVTNGGWFGGGQVRADYCDFNDLGDGTDAFFFYGYGTTGFYFQFNNCVVDGCDSVTCSSNLDVDQSFALNNTTFKNGTATYDINIAAATTKTSGTRQIAGCVFGGLVTGNFKSFTWGTENLFLGGYSAISNIPDQVPQSSLFFKSVGATEVGLPGGATDCIFLFGGDNPHYAGTSAVAGTHTFDGCLFQADGTATNGDCIVITGAVAATTRVIRCQVLPNENGGQSGSLVNCLTEFAGNTFSVEKCTFVTAATATGVMNETVDGNANQCEYVYDCIGYGAAITHRVISYTTNPVNGFYTVANYNCGWSSTGEAFTDNYEPTDAKFGTAPGANDVNQNPQFPAPTRNLIGWDASLGGPGTTANVIAEMRLRNEAGFDSNYTVANALVWIRAGWASGNVAFNGTGHDAGDIGAVAYAEVVTGGPASLLLLGIGG